MKEEVLIHSSIVDVMVGEREKIIAGLEQRVNELESARKWINFREQRPAERQRVLWCWNYQGWKPGDFWQYAEGYGPSAAAWMIFWQPLPEPPTLEQIAAVMEKEKAPYCKQCNKVGEASHPCPYKSEIADDSETRCECCANCQAQCNEET